MLLEGEIIEKGKLKSNWYFEKNPPKMHKNAYGHKFSNGLEMALYPKYHHKPTTNVAKKAKEGETLKIPSMITQIGFQILNVDKVSHALNRVSIVISLLSPKTRKTSFQRERI